MNSNAKSAETRLNNLIVRIRRTAPALDTARAELAELGLDTDGAKMRASSLMRLFVAEDSSTRAQSHWLLTHTKTLKQD